MVKDHQIQRIVAAVFTRRLANNRMSPSRIATRRHSPFASGLLVLMIVCGGCQSGLVDSGWSRGGSRPPQSNVLPAPPNIHPGFQLGVQPNPPTGIPPANPGVSTTPGMSSNVWGNVTRQPATSVVKLSPEEDSKAKYHTVVAGESWSSLAQKYGLTVKQLADANGIDPTVPLQPGQIVYTVHGEN